MMNMEDTLAVADQACADVVEQAHYIHELETVLGKLVEMVYDSRVDSEGHYPALDAGCNESTVGTVPNKRNTGLCAYHAAKELLGLP